MANKVVQVPVDEELLKNLDNMSRKQHKARAQLIREACLHYLRETEEEELDRIYQLGYKRIPEGTEIADAQVAMLDKVWPRESW